ncbi:hypothetical protein C0J56_01195 [Pseudomonas fluorescens]|nr:hypothetical protein C0J56_01195 [Pseudomonas fluorescens]
MDWGLNRRGCGRHRSTCGSGLARESSGPDCIDGECIYAFASKPPPTALGVADRLVINPFPLWERACSRCFLLLKV